MILKTHGYPSMEGVGLQYASGYSLHNFLGDLHNIPVLAIATGVGLLNDLGTISG
jgi:hypothetical protein